MKAIFSTLLVIMILMIIFPTSGASPGADFNDVKTQFEFADDFDPVSIQVVSATIDIVQEGNCICDTLLVKGETKDNITPTKSDICTLEPVVDLLISPGGRLEYLSHELTNLDITNWKSNVTNIPISFEVTRELSMIS